MYYYIVTSTLIHAILLLGLCLSPDVLTSGGANKIEVNIVERRRPDQKAFVDPTRAKPLIPGQGAKSQQKAPKFEINDYGDKLKSIVDPVFMRKITDAGLKNSPNLTTIVLLFLNKDGILISMKVTSSSGNVNFDNAAISSLKEIHQFPIPPESLIKDGIEWSFSTGQGS